MSDISIDHCPNCNTVLAPEFTACVKCGRKRDQKDSAETEGDRTAIHAQTLARYRQHRDTIRAVKILAGCCPTCDLDGGREFSLDAVPALPHPYCTNPTGCHCCYIAVMHGSESTIEVPASSLRIPSPFPPANAITSEPHQGFLHTPMTPLAAIIGACAVVLFLGFTVLQKVSGPAANRFQTTVAPLRTLPSRTAAAPRAPELKPEQFVLQPREEDRIRDRQIEATAARDLAQAEAEARANANAMQANAIAAQQQAYLQSVFQQIQSRPVGMRADRSATMANITTSRSVQ